MEKGSRARCSTFEIPVYSQPKIIRMKNLVNAFAAALLLMSCTGGDNYKIDGTAEGVKDGTAVYLQEISGQNQLKNLDTTKVKGGKFSFDPTEVEMPDLNLITVDGIRGNVIFIAENENIKVKVNKDSIVASTIKGGAENDYFKNYFDEVMGSNKERQRINQQGQAAFREGDTSKVESLRAEMENINDNSKSQRLKMVEGHPGSTVSVIILTDLLGTRLIEPKKAEEEFKALDQKVQDSDKGKKLKEMIAKAKSQEIASKLPEIGNKAPSFTGPTPDGKEIALSDVLGKYTIVDFWASWCKPCRMENPNVVKLYKKYHEQGLNIISVSLDKPDNKKAWTDAIIKDNMTWTHVSHLKFWKEPIARKYGITAIPATFLLDENGVIVDKNLRGEALAKKMEDVFGKS